MDSLPNNSDSARLTAPQLKVLIGLVVVLPFVVQAVYFDGGFYYDDEFHLEQSELISRGEISLWDYATLAHGEHLIPVWKLLFYACWSVAGTNSALIHFVVTTFHVVATLLLFSIVRHYVSDRAAAVAALLWAGTAVGGWDGPFLWVAASHLSIGLTFMLAAMLCLTRVHTARSERWAMAAGLGLLACLLTMGSLLVLTPALLLQFWLFEYRSGMPKRQLTPWLLAWLLPCMVVGLLHLVWVLPAMEKLDRPAMNVYSGLQMLGGGYAASSWKLFSCFGDPVLWGKISGGCLICLLVLKASQKAQKTGVLFFALSLSFSLLAYMARSGWNVDHVLTWGRYRYLPTLFWCVVVGVVLEQIPRWMGERRKDWLPWMAVVGLIVFVSSQWRIATVSAAVFRRISSEVQRANAPEEKTQASAIDVDRNGRLTIQFGFPPSGHEC